MQTAIIRTWAIAHIIIGIAIMLLARCVFDASPDTARHLIELGRKDAEKTLQERGLAKAKNVAGGAMGMATNLWHKRPKLPVGKGKETQTR